LKGKFSSSLRIFFKGWIFFFARNFLQMLGFLLHWQFFSNAGSFFFIGICWEVIETFFLSLSLSIYLMNMSGTMNYCSMEFSYVVGGLGNVNHSIVMHQLHLFKPLDSLL
jgi:hypothetical protein